MNVPKARLHRIGGTGPDIMLVHGFGSDRLSWVANAPVLAQSARVWAVDLPGHGSAGNDVGDGSIQTLAQAVAAVLQEIDGPALIVGHSLGGAVAMELATLAPDRVSGLVLISPAGLGAGIAPDFLRGFPELENTEAAREMLERLVVRKRLIAPAMAEHVLGGLRANDRRAALRTIAARLEHLSERALPKGVRAILWGAEDRINPLPALPKTGFGDFLTLLDGTGHLPQIEAASKVNATILTALTV